MVRALGSELRLSNWTSPLSAGSILTGTNRAYAISLFGVGAEMNDRFTRAACGALRRAMA
jgi:hypothetical protein